MRTRLAAKKEATFLAFRSKTDPSSGSQWTRNESPGLLLYSPLALSHSLDFLLLSVPLSSSLRRSSSRDCRIVEGVRPFRGRFSSVKLFRCRRMPTRERYTPCLCIPTRGRYLCTVQNEEGKKPYVLYGSYTLWSGSKRTRNFAGEFSRSRHPCFTSALRGWLTDVMSVEPRHELYILGTAINPLFIVVLMQHTHTRSYTQ